MGKFLFELMGFIGKLAMWTGGFLFIFGLIAMSNDLIVTGLLIAAGGFCIYFGWYRDEL